MTLSATHFEFRPEWLAKRDEPIIEPSQQIIDSHHHLYERPGMRYLLDDYLKDTSTGHNVRASIFVQARAMLRADGPPELQSIGEVEFANGVAAMSASGLYGPIRVCAGIVGFADLMLGEAVRPVLERLIMAGGGLTTAGGRFCGIRQILTWDRDTSLLNMAYPTTETMIDASGFRAGFAQLAKHGLSFEVWAFSPQLPDIVRLARAFPRTQIVVNHCGGVVRIHGYQNQIDVFEQWKQGITALSQCENVKIKLSGLGMRLSDFGFETLPQPPSSNDLATAWRPWILHCLESFGPRRCMWGSNFPVDKGSYAFKVGLNAFKTLMSSASSEEKNAIFWRTAQNHYGLPAHLVNAEPG